MTIDTDDFGFGDLRSSRSQHVELSLCLTDGPNMSKLRSGGLDRRSYGVFTDHLWDDHGYRDASQLDEGFCRKGIARRLKSTPTLDSGFAPPLPA